MTATLIEQACQNLHTHIERFQPDRDKNAQTMADHARKVVEDTPWWNIPQHISNWWTDALAHIEKILNHFKDQAAEVAAWLRENVLPWLAGPVLLAQSRTKWQEVAQKAAMAQGQMSLGQIKGAIEWSGPAAKAYEGTVATQQMAAELTVTMIQKLQTFLQIHLSNVLGFILQIIGALTKLKDELIKLVAQFILAFDPTNWKEILKASGNALAAAADVQDKALTGMLEYIQSDINNMVKIQQDSLAVYQLPGGAASWPEPQANIDANVPGGWKAK